jgi:hypothetical protein
MLIPDGDKTASLLAARIQAGIGRAGGKGAIHPVSPADIGAALRRGDYQLFVLPFLPSTQDPLLCYEEMMQWNRSIPDSLMLQARALEGEGDASALSALLEPLDSSLQAGGYLYPLVSLERRLVVRRGICGLRPDPAGMLDWTRIWKSTTAGEDCE